MPLRGAFSEKLGKKRGFTNSFLAFLGHVREDVLFLFLLTLHRHQHILQPRVGLVVNLPILEQLVDAAYLSVGLGAVLGFLLNVSVYEPLRPLS
ncbi:MAG: hypothetical protein ACE14S_04015 [Candidatus Bathyarchaeia archaeon]